MHRDLGLGQREIARALEIGQSTLHDYLRRWEASGLGWPLESGLSDAELERKLFGKPKPSKPAVRPLPDFTRIQEELRANKHVSLQLLWEEYRDANPTSHYSYASFWRYYDQWRDSQDVVMRQEHVAGEKLFVDWAGPKLTWHDPKTGIAQQASLFVAVLGASNYTYAEATLDEKMERWLRAHVNAIEFFGGAPRLFVPDNTRTAVTKACRYSPEINTSYLEMARYYGAGVVPARPYKPRDKAKVEVGVQIAERWILASLRHRRFHSLGELNEAVRELLTRLNERPFKKREGSRASAFAGQDRPALQPIPPERYEVAIWKQARVNIDYHVEYERCLYSVPYQLTGKMVEIAATSMTVEILHEGQRVASHQRLRKPHAVSTVTEHRAKAHQAHAAWPPSRLIHWAQSVGPHTAKLVEQILAQQTHPEMGYRGCLGLLRLAEKYTLARMEATAERCLLTNAISYKSARNMLVNAVDRVPLDKPDSAPQPAGHDNIRGANYYE
jgi:transposase